MGDATHAAFVGEVFSRSHFVRNERVIVYRQCWNRKVMARGMSPADFLAIGAPVDDSVRVNWCGRDLSSDRWAWTQPGGEIHYTTSERSDHVVALIRDPTF